MNFTNFDQSLIDDERNNQAEITQPFRPPCNNGINEELFDKVVDVLSTQGCDVRGPNYVQSHRDTDGDVEYVEREAKADKPADKKVGKESFNVLGDDYDIMYWLMIVLLIVVVIMIYRQNYKP